MKRLISKLFNWYFTKDALPYWLVLGMDCVLVFLSGYVGAYIEMGGAEFTSRFWPLTWGLAVTVIIFAVCFKVFHTYQGILRYSSFSDLRKVFEANILSAILTYMLSYAVTRNGIEFLQVLNLKGIIVMTALSSLAMGLIRVLVKTAFEGQKFFDTEVSKAFIYGTKSGGVAIAKSLNTQTTSEYKLAGFIYPGPKPDSEYLMSVKVYPEDENIIKILQVNHITAIFVSPLQSDAFRKREDLINELIANDISIFMMPEAEAWDGKSQFSHSQLREVEIEDLLPREKIEINMDAIGKLLADQRILITGAAGSIGAEIVRQVAAFHPAEMILIDQAETPMHDIRLMMNERFAYIKAETIVASITNQECMENIFSRHKPDYVFHAAAYKHVPMMEDNPSIAVQNNICGTRVIADLAVKYGTKKFVMISTDKAVNPTNVMGCSKRICEIYCQSLNKAIQDGKVNGETQFVTTRFGNVLGSNGSVIPIFRRQIAAGGPVTVTDPNMVRYFMLISEACKLVLEAGTMGKGGEIFVFDMGQPVKIASLAKRMIALSGATDVKIKYVGLRDGEKLYEEVLADAENTVPTNHPKIMVAKVREYEYEEALANEERLIKVAEGFDDMAVVKVMKEIVPEYKSRHSKYESLD